MSDWSRAVSASAKESAPPGTTSATRKAPEATTSGHRGLVLEEELLFEQGSPDLSGVDLPPVEAFADRLGSLERKAPIGLPGLSEPQVVRHFTRLSQKNYAIDCGLYPLGSCTMKYNPRANERVARLDGFAEIHPLQPAATIKGALQVIEDLAHWLEVLTGMPAIALSPGAGAHGELCGMMTIKAALESRGEERRRVLVAASAHGTNPASAATCGYEIEAVPSNEKGRLDLEELERRLGADVAALMLTNPNTCGLFEDEICEIAEALHRAGAFFYCDGANFNALLGRVRPGDLGIDCMHLNLHKTFSTPHGGGGPGSGPVALSAALAPFAPLPWLVHGEKGLCLREGRSPPAAQSIGRIKGFHGQFGTFVRALAYLMSLGADGLKGAAEDAVLNANYLRTRLEGTLSLSFPGMSMHEVLFDDRFLEGTGVSTLAFAKAMIDEGFHPMTVYFPLVVKGAMLIEPTETESKASLDAFVASLEALAQKARAGEAAFFHEAPRLAPRRRFDEVAAARHPVLRWRPKAAAENGG